MDQAKPSNSYFEVNEHITDIYHDLKGSIEKVQTVRYRDLTQRFEKLYETKPRFFFRAPGRVNLIGEHVDYSGYAVFPCALEQDTLIAYAPNNEDKIVINHVEPKTYPPATISTSLEQEFTEGNELHQLLPR